MSFKKALLYITILSVLLTNIFTTTFAMPETASQESTSGENTEPSSDAAQSSPARAARPEVAAEAAILIDADTGVILYEKNIHEKLYPASITKIMTVLLACENGNFDDNITHSHNAVYNIGPGSSHIGMREGETISFSDALYGILLASANEVCMAVAEHIDGTVEKFVDRMNKRAQELGCVDTHFANPHGFHDPDHYTTAYDMSLITKAAVHNEKFLEFFSTPHHNIPPTNIVNETRYLHNKDKMLLDTSPYYYEYAIGGKTGFHDDALNTLVTYAGKDDMRLISVVLKVNGAAAAYSDTVKLMEYGFTLYEDKTLLSQSDYTADIPVIQHYKDRVIDLGRVSLKPESDFDMKVPYFIDKSAVTAKASLDPNTEAPVAVGTEIGTLDLYYNDYKLGSRSLVAATGLDAIPQSELEHRESMENLKAFALSAAKYTAAILAALLVIIFAVRLINGIRRRRNGRYKRIYSYSGKYGGKSRKKKVKYKFKIK